MERMIFGETCESFKRAPYIPKVKGRTVGERSVIQFGLCLNAVVIGLVIYAEFFIR